MKQEKKKKKDSIFAELQNSPFFYYIYIYTQGMKDGKKTNKKQKYK